LKGPLSPSTVNHITDSSGIPRTFATGLLNRWTWVECRDRKGEKPSSREDWRSDRENL